VRSPSLLGRLGAQAHPRRQRIRLRVHQRAAVGKQHHRQLVRIKLPVLQQFQGILVAGNVQPSVGHMVAGEKAAHPMVPERPAVPDHAQPLKGRLIAGLPVSQEVGQHRIQLFFRRVPGFVQVVVDAGRVDGPDGRFGVSRNSTPVMPGMRWSLTSSATGSWRVFSWASVSNAAWPLAARMTLYVAPYSRRRS
jgi:hypothetical protein